MGFTWYGEVMKSGVWSLGLPEYSRQNATSGTEIGTRSTPSPKPRLGCNERGFSFTHLIPHPSFSVCSGQTRPMRQAATGRFLSVASDCFRSFTIHSKCRLYRPDIQPGWIASGRPSDLHSSFWHPKTRDRGYEGTYLQLPMSKMHHEK